MFNVSLIRKSLIGAAVVATVVGLVFGHDAVSYVWTAWTATRDAVKRDVPVEFEVERARTAVAQLTPAIQKALRSIAEQQVEIEHLSTSVARRAEELEQQKNRILTLRKDLDSGKQTFRYASYTYSADEVRHDLSHRFERFKSSTDLLTRDQRILRSRQQSLAALQKQLDDMLAQKGDLEAQVEQMAARMQMIRAEQVVSAPQVDESELSNVKRLIAEVNTKLDVQQKMLDADAKFVGLIPVDSARPVEPTNVTVEIDAYFSHPAEGQKAVVAKTAAR